MGTANPRFVAALAIMPGSSATKAPTTGSEVSAETGNAAAPGLGPGTAVKSHIHPNSVKLKAYNGQQINTKGMCKLKGKIKEKEHQLMFVVIPDGHDSLLGDKACENVGLVKSVLYKQHQCTT